MDEKTLIDLRQYLKMKTGKYYFKDIRVTENNLIVTCPFHKGGQENKPSANIRTTEAQRADIGMFHCFTCGEKMMITDVIKKLLGDLYNEDEIEARFGFKSNLAKNEFVKKKTTKIEIKPKVSRNENELKHYRYYSQYLANRRITQETAIKYDIGFDINNNQVTFPIRDIHKNCLGIGRRNIDKKRYEYPKGMIKPLYGVYELPKYIRYLWIVEGPFNLWSLYQYGKTGVALLGTGTEGQYKQLLNIDCFGYVLALDPDEAGRNGIRKLSKYLEKYHKTNINVTLLPDGMDINDLTSDQFKQIDVLDIYTWRSIYGY